MPTGTAVALGALAAVSLMALTAAIVQAYGLHAADAERNAERPPIPPKPIGKTSPGPTPPWPIEDRHIRDYEALHKRT